MSNQHIRQTQLVVHRRNSALITGGKKEVDKKQRVMYGTYWLVKRTGVFIEKHAQIERSRSSYEAIKRIYIYTRELFR